MAICPRGHNSIADDFCDACGRPIGQQSAPQTGTYGKASDYPAAPTEPCPVCHTPREGATRFCEACGHEFGTPYDPGYGWRGAPGDGYPAGTQFAEGPGDYSSNPPPPQPGGYQEQQPGQSQPGQSQYPGYADPSGHTPSGRSQQPGQSQPHGQSQPQGGAGGQPYGQYQPQTSAPAGYPPTTGPQSAGAYQEPAYTDEWGGGTVLGAGPVPVPPPPPHQQPQAPAMLPTDFHPGPVPPRTTYVWTVLITADAEYFERVVSQGGPDAHAMRFPPYHETWAVALEGDRMRVGRRRAGGSGADIPEIDLSGPPSDPGISHLHVVLMNRADGSWQLVDPGSTNGTTLNGGKRAIEFNVPVDLHDGDRIHVGAWTTLEVRLRSM